MTHGDTIVALATGAGRAGVAIVRASGSGAGAAIEALTQRPLPPAFVAAARVIRHPVTQEPLDFGLVLFMPPPSNYTGEDVAEIHVHGGSAIIGAVIDALLALPGVRLAEPGEFTRRAFENGKLDLTQAEGLADLVDAETEGQRRQALRQYRGALEARIEQWRERLIRIMALCEAEIDFPEEGLPGELAKTACPEIDLLKSELASFLEDAHRGERIREGYRIAIIGAPNAGKSSLLNALAQREAAIVSDIPGTTRDIVEVRLVLAGFPVWIADTAGLREASNVIEAEGVRRALERARDADLRIGVIDGASAASSAAVLDRALSADDLVVATKRDLGFSKIPEIAALAGGRAAHVVSAKTGEGMQALAEALEQRVARSLQAEEAAPLTRARHRRSIEEAHAALTRAEAAFDRGAELAAEDLRLAARGLGRITGKVDVEDILGEIFSRFCIGK